MPIFQISNQKLVPVEQTNFVSEKEQLNPKDIANLPSIARDVSDIGHYGTGDLEITVASAQDLEAAKEFINAAYQKVGG